MDWIIELLVVMTVIGFMMARQASRYLWTAVAGAALAWWSIRYTPTTWALLTAWSLFLPVAILLTIPVLRRARVTRHLLSLYRKIMPGEHFKQCFGGCRLSRNRYWRTAGS